MESNEPAPSPDGPATDTAAPLPHQPRPEQRRVEKLRVEKPRSAPPRVDVVIPAYNAAAYVQAAVASALAQRHVAVQVFVVSGGSTDDTPARVAAITDPRIHLVTESRRLSASQARNIGTQLGSAPWIGYLDADDLWPQDRTAALIAAITEPEQQIAYGHMLTFPDGAAVDTARVYPPGESPRGPNPGTTVFSRVIHERVGELDETLHMAEFIDWMARARNLGIQEVAVPIVALLHRAHAHNTTRGAAAAANPRRQRLTTHEPIGS